MTGGIARNTDRLFDDKGHLFLLALDHAQSGVTPGLEKSTELMERLSGSSLNGFILNVGMASRMAAPSFLRKKLVLRTSFGGSQLANEYAAVHANHVSPETALALGADAVLMMAVIGGPDHRSLQAMAADIDSYHRLSIPVIAEIIASDFSKTSTFDIQYHGARIAAELGADVVKAFFVEGFDKVTASCPVPLILAGGPKDRDIFSVAAQALREGARGFAFGRNIFQAEAPGEIVAKLGALL
ncbi:MAG: class I fructose-bisphosphate aldolase [Spirochaetales bacterium]